MTRSQLPSGDLEGRIAYRAPSGEIVGRERFELLSNPCGHTLRAWCEIDETQLHRDVTLAMDAYWRPLDAFLRLTKAGEPLASLFFDVRADEILLSGTVERCATDQLRLATGERLAYLGLHPLQGDALIVEARGTDRPGTFVTIDAATNSISPDGDERPGLVPVAIDVAYLGEEELEVTAGPFAARHYALRWSPEWPAAHLWVTPDRPVFLKMIWDLVPTRYELVSVQPVTTSAIISVE